MDYNIKSLSFDKLVNTQLFSEAANDYKRNIVKYNGEERHVYCKAPVGSNEWNEYWALQEYRCMTGFKVGDAKITGRQYYNLNFFPMTQPVGKGATMSDTQSDFPKFMLIQYLWFTFKHIARYGGTFLGIESPGGKDICGLKTRSAGFSYMNASDGCYNFSFKDGSKTFYLGYSSEFITDEADSTLVKVEEGLDWLNNHTGGVDKYGRFVQQHGQPFGEWRRNRTGSMSEGWIAEFKDASGYAHGSKSAISPVICNSPRKARGKRGDIIIEEAGSFPNLLSVLKIVQGNTDMSGTKIGQIAMFGTGGEDGPGIEALDMAYWNPDAYNMLGFPNIWEDAEHEKVGFFCPVWLGRLSDCDENGNPNPSKTIRDEEKIRAEQPTPQESDKRTAEYPFTPSEGLKRLTNNKFPQKEIEAQLKLLDTNKVMAGRVKTGVLELDKDSNLRLEPTNIIPVQQYPIKQSYKDEQGKQHHVDLRGCIEILEHPYLTNRGLVPEDLYFQTVDCYSVDDAQEVISLYSCKIWKHYNLYDNEFSGVPVAWFVGRRENQEECFEITLRLSLYYGACKIMGEHNAQGQLLINYIKNKGREDLLMRESDLYHNKEKDKKVKNYFQNITTDAKKTNIGLLADRMKERIGFDEDGKPITTISLIYDKGYLREMLKFNPMKGNFDRISDASLAPIIFQDRAMNSVMPGENDEDEYSFNPLSEMEDYLTINDYVGGY